MTHCTPCVRDYSSPKNNSTTMRNVSNDALSFDSILLHWDTMDIMMSVMLHFNNVEHPVVYGTHKFEKALDTMKKLVRSTLHDHESTYAGEETLVRRLH